MADGLEFLTERLSGFRSKYYPVICNTAQALLSEYDKKVLGGYSDGQLKAKMGTESFEIGRLCAFKAVNEQHQKCTTRSLKEVDNALQMIEDRAAFLYGVRDGFVELTKLVGDSEKHTKEIASIVDKGNNPYQSRWLTLGFEWLHTLQDECEGLKVIYEFMRDEVLKSMTK